MIEPILTPRQLEAQRLYQRKMNRIRWPIRLSYFVGCLALIGFLYLSKARIVAGQSPVGDVMLAALLFAAVIAVIELRAHQRAFDAVRQAGLLDESREIVARTNTNYTGEDLEFGRSKNRWSDAGLLLVLVAVAALLGWFALGFATQISERILALSCFAFFAVYAVIVVACWNQPAVRLDGRGVFSHHRNFWPRLVRWHQVESAHFDRWTNFHDGAEILTIELKNAAGKTLLALNAATFAGAPPDFEARFRAELRRRLAGDNANKSLISRGDAETQRGSQNNI